MIQVIERVAKILGSFALDPNEARSMTELAEIIQVEVPTCSNIVRTLVDLGYLEPVPHKKGYRLGPEPWRITAHAPFMEGLRRVSTRHLEDLGRKIRESTVLSVLQGPRRINLLNLDGTRMLRVASGELVEPDPLRFATCRAQLAHMPDGERTQYVKRCGFPGAWWDGIDDTPGLESACAAIRGAGHALSENGDEDLVGIGFPILNRGTAIAAVGIFLPSFRFQGDTRGRILEAGAQAAKAITEDLMTSTLHPSNSI